MKIRSVCVFCGSAPGAEVHRGVAAGVGELLAREGLRLIYGGASVGSMGILASAAHGVLTRGLVAREIAKQELTRLEIVDTLAERKQRMCDLSDAFLVLPGGYGTLDELFEVLTWGQLDIVRKPVCLVNTAGFYDGLVAFLDGAVTSGYLRPEHRALLFVEATAEAALECLRG
jgi:uncharacterized protein (TIGR00730 family)